jgi:4a-hydroxytetrahydrobiopterin dehydratase
MDKIARAPLTEPEINAALAKLPGWGSTGHKLVKIFQFKNFRDALAFIVRIGLEAEGIDHHPEIKNVYNKVELGLNTHDAGGRITAMDVELAARIEKAVAAKA